MFARVKKNGKYEYIQVVTSARIAGKVRQQVLGTLGRRDVLERSGALDGLAASLNKFLKDSAVLSAYRGGTADVRATRSLGPAAVFGKLWQELEVGAVLGEALAGRKFSFPVERAVFLTVLHRLMAGGSRSDRAAEKWQGEQVLASILISTT